MTPFAFAAMAAVSLASPAPAHADVAPLVDHHQHVFSPALVKLVGLPTGGTPALTARDVVALLDQAGIRRAVLLSAAYIYGKPSSTVEDEYAKVKAENDWVGAQAAQHPDRLRAFCGFNPLRSYALDELARCAKDPTLRRGIKLHLGNSDVQLEDPAHVAQLRRVFKAANDNGMAIVVHLRASISKKRPYGATQARAFLEQVLPAAPDVPVQVAHMAGTGPGWDDPPAHEVMGVLADAVEKRDPRTKRLWFDVTTVANGELTSEIAALLVKRIRQVGVDRVVYGSDAAVGDNLKPREAWAAFRRLPLTPKEIETIALNVMPVLESPL